MYYYQNFTTGVPITIQSGDTFRVFIRVMSGKTTNNVLIKPQIERGGKVNTYTPNGTSPIELNWIGNYRDYFYKNGNKWYLHKETKRIVLDGSENWGVASNMYYLTSITDYAISNNVPISDMFIGYSNVSSSANAYQEGDCKIGFINVSGGTTPRFYLRYDAEYGNLTTWLTTHNVTVIYALRTATNTEITDATLLSQLNAIDSAMAFETSTTIAQVNNDLPINLTVTEIGSATVSSNYRGEPIITVNDTGLIYFNGSIIKVNQSPMTINSQTMQAYNGNINLNNYIEINEFPMLKKGSNDIGSTMALSIVPNYWKL